MDFFSQITLPSGAKVEYQIAHDWLQHIYVKPSMKTPLRDCVEILMESQTTLFLRDGHFQPPVCGFSKQAGGTFVEFIYKLQILFNNCTNTHVR